MTRAQPAPAPGDAPRPTAAAATDPQPAPRLLRINEVAAETGLTTRAIRYYEEVGLLAPAARSEGDYRLYDSSDLDRLHFIRGLRDDAGFSLAQIGQLLEDDAARERNRERYRQTGDPDERRALLLDARSRTGHQIEILEAKAARLATMIEEAKERARHLDAHLAELDGAPAPHPPRDVATLTAEVRKDRRS
jgi:MerR family transcriptional regulator, repressor of the yfmOP operon